MSLVGKRYQVCLYQTITSGEASLVVVETSPASDGDHITVGVADGVTPYHAKSMVQPTSGECRAIYSGVVVPM